MMTKDDTIETLRGIIRTYECDLDAKDKRIEEYERVIRDMERRAEEQESSLASQAAVLNPQTERIEVLVAKLREVETASGERIIQMGGLKKRIAALEADYGSLQAEHHALEDLTANVKVEFDDKS